MNHLINNLEEAGDEPLRIEKRQRIAEAWDAIADQDNLSDEEALNIVAKCAGVTYGEAREVLCGMVLSEPSKT